MEEAVWISFGVLSVIILLGILTMIFGEYRSDNDTELFFQGVRQLGAQAEHVCKSPRETKLSIGITVPVNATLTAQDSRLCGSYGGDIVCVPSTCAFEDGTVLDLTSPSIQGLFASREYACTIERLDALRVSCEG